VIVLAVESATQAAGVALADDDGVLATVTTSRGRRHAESIAPAIEFVRDRTGVPLSALGAIAVDVGPGLFTGLRVGISTAKALAFGLGVPVVTATSLEVLAHAVAASNFDGRRTVVAVVDARRGEVFVGRFRVGPDHVEPLGDPLRQTPEQLASVLGSLTVPTVLVGDGALRYRSLLGAIPGATIASDAFAHPPVVVLATLGVRRARAGDLHDATSVLPRYLRDADTRINWERRARRQVAEV
jgi:tRNA threonylcarbamoyladenosine biosynthesis protein TsaB